MTILSRQPSALGDCLGAPKCSYEYKGGAKFYGEIVNFKRQGMGIMMYPDGDQYEGNFDNGVKEGDGVQKWLDGSVYTGPFKQGRRHGRGVHKWMTGESYEGEYQDDMRWGEGTYTWPSGHKFTGLFEKDAKCGRGTFFFANGNVFEGEYKSDERCGEGSMKYSDATEDRGCWRGCSLVKLSNSVLPASLLDIQEPSSDPDMCDMREVTKGFETRERDSDAGPMGSLETASQALLLAALKGNNASAVYLLQHTCVRPDVADSNGLTPLIAASVFCKNKIVNILLDNGANVNQLTDSGVSALMACHLHLYFNSNSGYEIQLRRDPLHPCKADEELEGPIELFTQTQHSAKLPADNEAESGEGEGGEGAELNREETQTDGHTPDQEVVEDMKQQMDQVNPAEVAETPTILTNEPTDGSDYTTVVVYGKRYFVRGPDVLSDLTLPETGIVPTAHQLRQTIKLLLKRGADPKVGHIPVPVLILAILARDVTAVQILLEAGADPTARLGAKYGCKSPLHVAAGLRGPGGPEIVKLLLEAGADPNVRDSLSFSRSGALQWKLIEDKDSNGQDMGTSPLQVACSMDHDYENSTAVIKLLLEYGADTNVICSGHSPLTLAIYSGNDTASRLLLKSKADASLCLGSPIGSALCSAVDTTCERRRTNDQRLEIINELMTMGADIMALVPVGKSGKHMGTAVDYAMHVFYQDKRIANTPFHALSPAEREIYIARTNLLNHMAELLREEVQKREMNLRDSVETDEDGKRSQKPKMLFKYCYECGRSTGVKLTPCTRCYTVSFCSQRCKLKAWTSRHRRECIKLENKQKVKKERLSPSASPKPETKETEQKQDSGKKKKGKPGNASKDMFGKKGKREGAMPDEPEIITHTLPRLVNLQHSQI